MPGVGRHQVIHLVPLLRPEITEQLRRDWFPGRYARLAILPAAVPARSSADPGKAVEPVPQRRSVSCSKASGVVSASRRATWRPGRETEFARAFIGEIYEARVVRPHRRSDAVPAFQASVSSS